MKYKIKNVLKRHIFFVCHIYLYELQWRRIDNFCHFYCHGIIQRAFCWRIGRFEVYNQSNFMFDIDSYLHKGECQKEKIKNKPIYIWFVLFWYLFVFLIIFIWLWTFKFCYNEIHNIENQNINYQNCCIQNLIWEI